MSTTKNGIEESLVNSVGKIVQYANTISDLRLLKPLNEGGVALTQGYYKVGVGIGMYQFDSSIQSVDDGGEYIKVEGVNGAWVLQPQSQISPEVFGAIGDKINDDASAIRQCSAFAEKYNIKIKGESKEGYYFKSNINIYTDFDVEGLFFNASEESFGNIYIKTKKAPEEIVLSSLSGLDEGSTKIFGLPPNAVGKYIRFSSNSAILTERNNGVKQYYYKNTTVNITSIEGNISPELDMTFNSSDEILVQLIPFETKIKIRIGKVGIVGAGNFSAGFLGIQRDNVDCFIDSMESNAQFKTFLSITANNCKLTGSIRDTIYEGYGYGVSIGNCCDVNIYDFKASNGRTELDGRHGSNVSIFNSKFKKAGSHWGNNYKFFNSDIDTISWSGRNLTVKDCVIHFGILNRTDICLSTGRFCADNITLHGKVFLTSSGNVPTDFFNAPRRFFDEILINNLRCTDDVTIVFGFGPTPHADYISPSYININNVFAPVATRMVLTSIPLDNSKSFVKSSIYNVENIFHGGVCRVLGRGFSKYTSDFTYNATLNNCGKIEVQADSNYFGNLDIYNSEVVSVRRINPKTSLGKWIFTNCKIKLDIKISPTLFYIDAPKGFQNCEYDGDMAGIASLAPILFSIGCRAIIGSINYPKPLSGGYFNPIYYINESI